jgi:general secretion pathway protein J
MKARSQQNGDSGLTLIELVVAMAIFALVAVMGLQALTGAMRMRDRLTEIDTETAELGLVLSLLRADLSAAVPLLFYPPKGPPVSALLLSDGGRTMGLSLAGQPDLNPAPGPGLQRAEWQYDAALGTLSRRAWPALYPAASVQPSPQVVLLRGLRGWSLRSHWPELGWVAGLSSGVLQSGPPGAGADSDAGTQAMPDSYSSTLPEAIELTLETESFGRIVLLESLK